jgi:polyhydroxyalkanoate synthase
MGAYMDWLVHLAWSPNKQLELVAKAQRKMLRLGQYACAPAAERVPCASHG